MSFADLHEVGFDGGDGSCLQMPKVGSFRSFFGRRMPISSLFEDLISPTDNMSLFFEIFAIEME
jgi:hypothetical protein